MKNRLSALMAIAALLFVALACRSVIDRATGNDKIDKTTELWSDVPKMDGMSTSDLELPWGIKLLMRTALNNLWRFNKEGEDKTPVEGDWIAFAGPSTPSEVENFYSKDRMASYGRWDTNKESTCINGKDKG